MLDSRKSRLIGFFKKHKRMPSYGELAHVLRRSKSTAHKIASGWMDEGFLLSDSSGRLSPGELHWQIPFLGNVDAGIPTDDELRDETVALDDLLVSHKNPTYMIRVRGNSMRPAHIVDGDYVLAEKRPTCVPGDVVVAKIDGSWTIKHLREDGNGKTYLQAADDAFSKIYPSHELHLVAVVTTVIRRFTDDEPKT